MGEKTIYYIHLIRGVQFGNARNLNAFYTHLRTISLEEAYFDAVLNEELGSEDDDGGHKSERDADDEEEEGDKKTK